MMRGGESARHLNSNIKNFVKRQLRRHFLAQRYTLDKLHGNELLRVCLAKFVDGDDVRMMERGRRARLTMQPPHLLLIFDERRGQKLERNFAIEALVQSRINQSHAAFTDSRENLIVANCFANKRFIVTFGKRSKRVLDNGSLQRTLRPLLIMEQGFDFASQHFVIAASAGKKISALICAKHKRRVKDIFDFLVSFVH